MPEPSSFKQKMQDAGFIEAPPTPRSGALDLMSFPTGGSDAYGRRALEDECSAVATCSQGSRNDRLNTAAFKLASLVASGHLQRETTIEALRSAARQCGLTEHETTATIRSAFAGSDAKVGARVVPELEAFKPDVTIYEADGTQTVPSGHTFRLPTDSVDSGTAEKAEPRSAGGAVQPERTDADTEQDDDDAPATATLEEIEAGFWQSRPYLTLIYDAAIARMASPWAVLACCMARALALVPPHIVLPPIIGAEGSLNWFAAISAKSGGGKGAAMAVAESLLPQDVNVKGIGSGEGMIEIYQRSDKDNAPEPVTSVLFSIEEIDSLGAMGGRSGQTTMAILRQGFSGEKLGYSYRGRQGEVVDKHSYRMTVVASVQPERAGVLFEDAGGGTPQRFMWFPGRDKRITADPPPDPKGHLELPQSVLEHVDEVEVFGSRPTAFRKVRTPAVLDRTIREARARSMSGDDDDALNSHALFCREKFAYALALLNGRTTEISTEDWELSGIAAAVSDWCRMKAQQGYARGLQRQSRERGEMRAHENDARIIVEHAVSQARVARTVELIVKHIQKHGPDTERGLYRRASKDNRLSFPTALLAAKENGLIALGDSGKWELA